MTLYKEKQVRGDAEFKTLVRSIPQRGALYIVNFFQRVYYGKKRKEEKPAKHPQPGGHG